MTSAENGFGMLLRYARLAATGPLRRGDRLPDARTQRQVRPDPARLTDYSRVCGFDLDGTLPVTFPHVLAFGDTLRLLALPEFPFAAIGLVHIRNSIEQFRPIGHAQELTLRSRFGPLDDHRRGQQFDILVDALAGDTVVWRSASRYLHVARSGPGAKPDGPEAPRAEPRPVRPTGRWVMAPDAGRRYAAVSGDPNPIHLHPIGALLGGRRRPIAHGMWLLARCVAALAGRLPAAYRLEVSFRRPVQLPSQVGFAAWLARDGRSVHDRDFQLCDLAVAGDSGVRLTGSVRSTDGPGSVGVVR